MNKKEKIVTVVALVTLVLITVGISYAAFTYIGQGQRENTIQTGNLTFVYDESNKSGNGISIENETPTSDELGSVSRFQGEVFEFSVAASTKGAPIYYEIYTIKQDSSTLPEKVVKTYLTSVQGEEETGVPNTLTNETINTYNKLGISQVPDQEGGRTLYQEMIPAGLTSYAKTFRYRMWLSNTATEVDENGTWIYNNMSFTVRINVYASNEHILEPITPCFPPEYVDNSGANKPVLLQGQIPVVYNSCSKEWVKADLDKSYDYSTQNWSNAVTVTEINRETYMNAEVGTPISMDDINTMWVWIPRYEYMYTNLGDQYADGTSVELPGEIKINFLSGTATNASDNVNYKVHSAFTFGSDELEGFWYGKFETSTTDSICNANASEANCNKLMESLQVKPNVSSWRNAKVSNFFTSSRNMQLQYASTYGLSTTDSDIHMSKNSEWGAVAYLSQSKYGKYGNPNYEGSEKEVKINNCSDHLTGVGANSQDEIDSASTCTTNTYDTANGMAASTTGNITGIYDMSGGSWEYVMGVLADTSGNPRSGQNSSYNSGFNGSLSSGSYTNGIPFPDNKYYDLYANRIPSSGDSILSATACNNGVCFGHALSETSGWYSDYANFLPAHSPWFVRGGYYHNRVNAGVFGSDCATGSGASNNNSFRLTHVPLK